MDRTLFDNLVKEVWASFGKPDPRPAMLVAAYKQVADYPDEFMLWAAEQMQDSDKLPVNLGRELRKSWYPGWKASQIQSVSMDQFVNDMCGDPQCPECHGKGWFYVWRRGARPGTAPTAIPCICNVTCDAFPDIDLKKATLADLKANGWTFREPPRIRNRPPTPLKFSLQSLLDRLHAGYGVPQDAYDPRRELPEEYL